MSMALLEIENMEFYAHHGHYEEERAAGSTFLVSLSIQTDIAKAAESDDLVNAVDYQSVYNVVKEQMSITSSLIETVAKRISDALYKEIKEIKNVTVKVSKINPQLGGMTERVSITVSE